MVEVTFKGNPVALSGELPKLNELAPPFRLCNGELQDIKLDAFEGKRKVLSIVPSLDTGVCAASVRRFNEEAAALDNTVVLTISADLPFAQSRFCGAEGIHNVITLSSFRSPEFGDDYGMHITAGPLTGLLGRAVLVLNESNQVIYRQLVTEITEEPDYEAALQPLVD